MIKSWDRSAFQKLLVENADFVMVDDAPCTGKINLIFLWGSSSSWATPLACWTANQRTLKLVNQPELLPESMTLYPSKIKWVLILLVCFIFITMGISLIGDHNAETLLGLFVCVMSGFGILISVLTLWPDSSWLKLGPDGIRNKVMFRKFHYRWSDINRFGITTVQHGVGLSKSKTEFVSFWMNHDDEMRSLSECYGKKTDELVEILESYRNRYG